MSSLLALKWICSQTGIPTGKIQETQEALLKYLGICQMDITVSDIYWPTPKLIPYPPLMTYGYEDFVIFPFKFTYEDFNPIKKR